jgi:hypothetical protein
MDDVAAYERHLFLDGLIGYLEAREWALASADFESTASEHAKSRIARLRTLLGPSP